MTTMKLIAMAGAFSMCTTMGASTAAFAQSEPYCGPNAPAGDTYGVPASGSAQARAGARLCQHLAAHNGRYGWRWRDGYYYRR
jgi:hypothetical protein